MSRNVLNILNGITKVLMIILVLKFGDGKTVVTIWPDVIIKREKYLN